MLTDQQIDEFLELLAKSPTSARDMVRGLFAAHEAKAAPDVPEIDYEALIHAAFAKNAKWAQGTAGCIAFSRGAEWFRDQMIAAPSQEPVTLRDYADSLIKAGHEFWKACRRDAGGGAVRWLSCDDGTLIVFTRGEYRDAIMGAVGGYRATEVVFEDQANDEQGGVVACAAPSQPVTQPVTLTDEVRKQAELWSATGLGEVNNVDHRHSIYCASENKKGVYTANDYLAHKVAESLNSLAQEAGATDAWFSVEDQKPPTNKPVLIHYLTDHHRSKIVRAHYIPAKTVEAGEDDEAEEYDEESDTYFVQEGWYEDNSESEVNYGITGEITHWRNLPPAPAIIAALREKEQTK